MATDRELGKIELAKLAYGYGYISESNTKIGMMEDNTNLQSLDCPFPELIDGTNMFKGCINLKTVKSNFPKLTHASKMFHSCTSADSFTSNTTGNDCINFDKVSDGSSMFFYCEKLPSFYGQLSSLTNATSMFEDCTSLSSFKTNSLNNLEIGEKMFYSTKLSQFKTSLDALTDGRDMFNNCKTLTHFDSNLSKLEKYQDMFNLCPLQDFRCNTLNLSNTTGADFMTNSGLAKAKDSLVVFYAKLPNFTDTKQMFFNYPALRHFYSSLPNITAYENISNMFDCCTLESFVSDVGISCTGEEFMRYSYLSNSQNSLMYFEGHLTNMTNTNTMFKDYTALKEFKSYMPKVTHAENMFQQCSNLSKIDVSNCDVIEDGSYMFYNCISLSQNNINLGQFYNSLCVGTTMFAGSNISSIPWNFPELVYAISMFAYGKFTTLNINSSVQFPKLNTTELHKKYPGAYTNFAYYMFRNCENLTTLDFDVSTIDNAQYMFYKCTALTTCNNAKFANGGVYNNMFTDSKFNESSAHRILYYAKQANVSGLHLGIGFQLTENHNFAKNNKLIKWSQDNSGRQWCEGYAYCHCHNDNEEAAREYFKEHGVTKHCHEDNAITYYLEFPSIMIVCNPN